MAAFNVPEYGAKLANEYFAIRLARKGNEARRRKGYRVVRAECDRLIGEGYSRELLRLLCRALANPRDEARWKRFSAYRLSLEITAAFRPSRGRTEAAAERSTEGASTERVSTAAKRPLIGAP